MTGQDVPGEPRHRAAGRPRERALATHKPCPLDDCPGPARFPTPPTAPSHGAPATVPCRRCGADPCLPPER
ncbi:hypothetical protein AB0D74_30365 [Streptomyces sp. NPDC048278]|uniref:hypothetical protein n=1 Tax=unclassified Streptomyces TaxID=2593676 RepID=UPI00342B181F